VVAAGAVPWTVLRATPFHEFVGQVARRGRLGPVTFVPRLRTAPVAAADVAAALADIVDGPPLGRAPDIGGPREEDFAALARRLLRTRGTRAIVVPISWPGRAGRAMREGAQVPAGGSRGSRTFDDWLADEGLTGEGRTGEGRTGGDAVTGWTILRRGGTGDS
jgi:uncharacterized protein YbjT (DUF2867 family)